MLNVLIHHLKNHSWFKIQSEYDSLKWKKITTCAGKIRNKSSCPDWTPEFLPELNDFLKHSHDQTFFFAVSLLMFIFIWSESFKSPLEINACISGISFQINVVNFTFYSKVLYYILFFSHVFFLQWCFSDFFFEKKCFRELIVVHNEVISLRIFFPLFSAMKMIQSRISFYNTPMWYRV